MWTDCFRYLHKQRALSNSRHYLNYLSILTLVSLDQLVPPRACSILLLCLLLILTLKFGPSSLLVLFSSPQQVHYSWMTWPPLALMPLLGEHW